MIYVWDHPTGVPDPHPMIFKKQNVVEPATYGSVFMVACQVMEQIRYLHYTLSMLGIPIDGPFWLLGKTQSVISSSTTPLPFYQVRQYTILIPRT
jgi:hypothetical protein